MQDEENVMTFENFLVAYSVFDLFAVGSETVLPIPAISQLGSFLVEFDDGNLVVKSLIDIPKDKIITFSALSLTKPIEDLLMHNIYPIEYELALPNVKHAIGIDLESLESLITQQKLDILNSLNNLSFTHYLTRGRKCHLLPIQLGVLFTTDEIALSNLLNQKKIEINMFDSSVMENVNHVISAMVENFASAFSENEEAVEDQNTVKYRTECKTLLSSLLSE